MNTQTQLSSQIADYLKKPHVPFVTGFLDAAEQRRIILLLAKSGRAYRFDGGYPQAERALLCLAPQGEPAEWTVAPLAALVFKNPGAEHRHVLGALMHCGVRRDTIGDIAFIDGRIQVVVLERVAPFLKENFTRLCGQPVQAEILSGDAIIPYVPETEAMSTTAASERLDSVIACTFGMSRQGAQDALRRDEVLLNHETVSKPTRAVRVGDTISVRRKGKIRITQIGEKTKKGRVRVDYERYK